MKNCFFLFPGQGAQYTGMSLDLLNAGDSSLKDLFTLASDSTGMDMKAVLEKSDAAALKRTDISQPAITLANLAAALFLAQKGIEPVGCAGFSLGEYAALAVAKIISFEECFLLVKERGKAMQAAADRLESGGEAPGMAAVIGLPPERVESLIAQWKKEGGVLKELYAANLNSVKQTVVSGTAAALAEGTKRFKEAGARLVMPLAVAGPFHSPLMAEAAEAFKLVLEKISFKNPAIPFYSNVSGKKVLSGDAIKKLSLAQITMPVRWTDEEAAIQADGGFDVCLEAGPGKVLLGLWKETACPLSCVAAGTVEAINNFLNKAEN
jgi:[acyl-carrier-protein] S-malonyltransferase